MTKVQISNMALGKFCEARLLSYEEATPAGKTVRQYYDEARREVLSDAKWPFAIKRSTLPQLALPASHDWGDWTYAYQLPADLIQIVSVNDLYPEEFAEPSWVVEGQSIRLDDNSCRLKYIWDLQDSNAFSIQFRRALICKLAAMIAPIISGNPSFGQSFDSEYLQIVLPISRALDENQNNVRETPLEKDSEFLQARYS